GRFRWANLAPRINTDTQGYNPGRQALTHEERHEYIDQTLLQIVEIQRDQAGTQRQQAAVLLEIAQRHAALDQRLAELTERVHTVISAIDRFLDRWRNGRG